MLQAIGMTGGQLKKMLVLEGLLYTLAAVLASLLLTVACSAAARGSCWPFRP